MKEIASKRKVFLIISAVAVVVALLIAAVLGPNMGLDLGSGTVAVYSQEVASGEEGIAPDDFAAVVKEYVGGDVTVQQMDNIPTGMNELVVNLNEPLDEESQQGLLAALQQAFGDSNIEQASVANVQPAQGGLLVKRFVLAGILAGVLLMLFIGLRYKKVAGFCTGPAAVLSMLHSCLLSYGVLVLLGFHAGSSYVAASMTVCCCSLLETLFLYDAIRQASRASATKGTPAELFNSGAAACAPQLVMLSALLLVAVICAAIAAMVMGTNILSIAVPVGAGILFSLYSALCLNGSLWSIWRERGLAKVAAATKGKAKK